MATNEGGIEKYTVVKHIAYDGGDRRQFRIGLIRIGTKQYIEARVYYKDSQGCALPTKKGIVVTASNFLCLTGAIIAKEDEIRAWLGLSFSAAENNTSASNTATTSHKKKQLPRKIKWIFSNAGKSAPPFKCIHEGAEATVVYNEQCAWVKNKLQKCTEICMQAISELIIAEYQSRRIASQEADDEYDGIFGVIDLHKSVLLNNIDAGKAGA
jgi:hypothetical protein